MVGFLNPFVDDCTGPVGVHLGTEDGCLVGKGSWLGRIAAGFGDEDGNGVVYDLLVESFISRLRIRRISTPLICV